MTKLRSQYTMQRHANRLGDLMIKWLESVEPVDIWKGCLSCQHFKDDRICALVNAQPPGSVIMKGCEKYEDAVEIPF